MDSPALPPAPPPLVPAPPTPDAATMAGVSWSGLSYDVPVSPASTTSPAARARAWLAALTGRGSGGGGGGGNGDGGGGSPPAGRGPLLPTHMANGATPVAVPADLTAKGDDSGLSSGVSSGSSSGSSRPLAMKTPAADGAAAPNGVGGGDAATGTATAATAAARAPTGTPPRAPNTNRILHGVSGVAPAGQLTVLLGPSGAGKTSLLNLLAGRSQYGPSGGTMTFAGAPRGRRLRRQLAYCMQADIFSPRLTVAETLRFTARLRIRGASRAEREARVAGVLAQLRLEGCADTLMGDGVVVKGVSGGERKRVNIANELLTDPSTLLLDGMLLEKGRGGGGGGGRGGGWGWGGGGGYATPPHVYGWLASCVARSPFGGMRPGAPGGWWRVRGDGTLLPVVAPPVRGPPPDAPCGCCGSARHALLLFCSPTPSPATSCTRHARRAFLCPQTQAQEPQAGPGRGPPVVASTWPPHRGCVGIAASGTSSGCRVGSGVSPS